MVIKRNLLTIKKKEDLGMGILLLYEPYKNILSKFHEFTINPENISFDPISRAFDGLESISDELKHYYEAFLGITSYYQHSQGGKGKYVEKKLSSEYENCAININIKDLPIWLENPLLYRKKGILTISGLSSSEKQILRTNPWNWIYRINETTDIGSFDIEDKKIVLVEIKNRVDSGGTSARREIWTNKFKNILEIISSDNVFEKENTKYSLVDFLQAFNINTLEYYIGILFNIDGTPATMDGDRQKGFLSSNKEGYSDIKNYVLLNDNFSILDADDEQLKMRLLYNSNNYNLEIIVSPSYGDSIPVNLFNSSSSVSDLLLLRYDDIWLSQLMSIKECELLLKYEKNLTILLSELYVLDYNIRLIFNRLIESEGSISFTEEIINYLKTKYRNKIEDRFFPSDVDNLEYFGDIVQLFAANLA